MGIDRHNIDDHIRANFSQRKFEWTEEEWLELGHFCKINGFTVEVMGTAHTLK